MVVSQCYLCEYWLEDGQRDQGCRQWSGMGMELKPILGSTWLKARALPRLIGLLWPLQLLPDWLLGILYSYIRTCSCYSQRPLLEMPPSEETPVLTLLLQALLMHAQPPHQLISISTHFSLGSLTSADPFLVYPGLGILGPVLLSWGMGISFTFIYMDKNF